MSDQRKISVLRALLDRVQKRSSSPRPAAPNEGVTTSPAVPSPPTVSGLPQAGPPRVPTASMGMPVEPPPPAARVADPSRTEQAPPIPPRAEIQARPEPVAPVARPGDEAAEADEGPPSAPRLRELPSAEGEPDERELPDEEVPIKTPPPESGKQHVTPAAASPVEPLESDEEEDDEISITVEESEPPPPVVLQPSTDILGAVAAAAPRDDFGVSGPQPRLALVSEPEIELHTTGMAFVPPLSAPATPAQSPAARATVPAARPSGVQETPPQEIGLAVSVSPGSVKTPVESVAAPPVRVMSQAPGDASGKAPAPVEVWASTHAPAALRGQVANFVGENAGFEPKSFGELLEASLKLGQETS